MPPSLLNNCPTLPNGPPTPANAPAILFISFTNPELNITAITPFIALPISEKPLIAPTTPLAIVINTSINLETAGKNISPIC